MNMYRKWIQLIEHDWLTVIFVKKSDIPKYSYNFDRSIIVEGIEWNEEQDDNICPLFKFKAKWKVVRDNLRSYGFLTLIESHFNFDFGSKLPILDEFWIAIRTKVVMEMTAGDDKLLQLPHYGDEIAYLKVWEDIAEKFPFSFSKNIGKDGSISFKLL